MSYGYRSKPRSTSVQSSTCARRIAGKSAFTVIALIAGFACSEPPPPPAVACRPVQLARPDGHNELLFACYPDVATCEGTPWSGVAGVAGPCIAPAEIDWHCHSMVTRYLVVDACFATRTQCDAARSFNLGPSDKRGVSLGTCERAPEVSCFIELGALQCFATEATCTSERAARAALFPERQLTACVPRRSSTDAR